MKFAFPSRLKSMARLGVGGRAGVVQGHRLRAVSGWAVGSVLQRPWHLAQCMLGLGLPLGVLTSTFGSFLMKFFKYSDKEERLIAQIPIFPHPDFLLVLQSWSCRSSPFIKTLTFLWAICPR